MGGYMPSSDGETHINVYSKGKTVLGKMLSNFYISPTEIEFENENLTFKTLEGFWYFYIIFKHTKQKYYEFVEMDGFTAKEKGKFFIDDLEIDSYTITNRKAFKARFQEALKSKIRQNKKLLSLLTHSELPFAHYYYYGDESNPKVIDKSEYSWMLETFDEVRTTMKNFVKNK